MRRWHLQPDQKLLYGLFRIQRQACDQSAKATQTELVHAVTDLCGCSPGFVKRGIFPGASPGGLPFIKVTGAMPGNLVDDVTGPGTSLPLIHGLGNRSEADLAFGCRWSRVDHPVCQFCQIEAAVPLGVLGKALSMSRLEILQRKSSLGEQRLEGFAGHQQITVPHVAQHLLSTQKRLVGQPHTGVHGHVIRKGPQRRDDLMDMLQRLAEHLVNRITGPCLIVDDDTFCEGTGQD